MSFPACPSCAFPDVPVADRAVEVATTWVVKQDEPPDQVTRTTVHRSYRCAGCNETFWTSETVQTNHAKAHKIQHLYRNPLR